MHKLENIYYLANLEKYLQSVSEFMDRLLSLEERVIENSKSYMREFLTKIEEIVNELKDRYGNKYNGCLSLEDLID